MVIISHNRNIWRILFNYSVLRQSLYRLNHNMTDCGKGIESDSSAQKERKYCLTASNRSISKSPVTKLVKCSSGRPTTDNSETCSRSTTGSSENCVSGTTDISENCVNTFNVNIELPPKPEEPGPDDCCGNGCVTCVLDIYQQELAKWEEECNRIKFGLPLVTAQTQDVAVLDELNYSAFKLESITAHTYNSNIYRFTLPHQASLSLTPGQHLILRLTTASSRLTRPYTPVSPPAAPGYFEVLIKIYAEGRLTRHLKDWKPDDMIEWRGPFGELNYKANSYSRVLLLAAGTGVAPMIQVIRHIVDNEKDETFVRLLYACRTYEDILMKEEIDNWTSCWNFTVLYALSQDSADRPVKKRYGDAIQYSPIVQKNISKELVDHVNNCLVLICGTKSFDQSMLNYVKEAGVPEKNVFKF